ncbi:MAG: pantoate--beta-alanine ligase [Desulfuromonadales bacterium]|nr:pantoate--beta-alanine ligase [Desulfuromonadales bacterium]
MKIITSITEMQTIAQNLKREGNTIAFVPTMGFLHEGHASLLREGRNRGNILILSLFVNPIQFGQNEDLDRYPRDAERDCRTAAECGVDFIFMPEATEMYPQGFQTSINVRELSKPLCGTARPGHFDGVATVVAKLFNIVMPDLAFFGRKDYQQLALIRRMVADLSIPVSVIGMPIIRESDGLAMSSRNAYLSPVERKSALALSRAIHDIRSLYVSGERSIETLRRKALTIILQEPLLQIDYLEFCNEHSLQPLTEATDDTLFALAVKAGTTRLIDNTVLGEKV